MTGRHIGDLVRLVASNAVTAATAKPAAKKPGGAGGVSQKVAKEFVKADHARGKKKLPHKVKKKGHSK